MDDLKKQYLNDLRKSNVTDLDIKNSLRVLETFNLALKTFYDTQIDNNSRLIDLGYGNGSFLKVLKKKNISSKGYDYDKINFENDKLPEDSNSIDFVTCNSVIEHLSDVTNLFKEVHRILKPNGKFLLVTPNFYYDYKNFYDDPTHINPFTIEKLNTALLFNDFKALIISGSFIASCSSCQSYVPESTPCSILKFITLNNANSFFLTNSVMYNSYFKVALTLKSIEPLFNLMGIIS